MNKISLLLLLLSACADAPAAETARRSAHAVVRSTSGQLSPVLDYDPLCDKIPDDAEGACANACDPDSFSTDLPAGVCAFWVCPLTDGTYLVVDACND